MVKVEVIGIDFTKNKPKDIRKQLRKTAPSADGSFKTGRSLSRNEVGIRDSSLHAGEYDAHELWEGTWRLIGDRLILTDGAKSFEAKVQYRNREWLVIWDSIGYRPNELPAGT